jgi:non-homologous end joining protein Ku
MRVVSYGSFINKKRAGKPITAKERPRGENVVDLTDALRRSIGSAKGAKDSKPDRALVGAPWHATLLQSRTRPSVMQAM